MKNTSEDGFITGLAVAFIVVCLAFIAALVFGISSYSEEQKYKNNTSALIAQAVQTAEKNQAATLNQQFQQQNQSPFTSYTGPSQYGSVYLPYPKNWSGYVDTSGNTNPLDGYFNPGVVPSVDVQGNLFALRLEINASSYSDLLSQYISQQQSGGLSITPYALKKVPQVVGVMISGQLTQNSQGVMVMLPLRTNTLLIWTDLNQYANLLENQILPNVSFQP